MFRCRLPLLLSLCIVAAVAALAQDVPDATPMAKPSAPQPYAGATRQVLRMGFAECDITPDRSASLMGYGFRADGNDGAHDPLMARVLAVSDGTAPGIIVSLDLCVLTRSASLTMRQQIAEAANTTVERVMVCTTHTHSGPYGAKEYVASIAPRVADAARRAGSLMFPTEVRVSQAPLGLAYTRRVRQPDGTVRVCWGPQEWPDRRPDPALDPTCTVVSFSQTNGPRQYLLWNFGAHPVVLGKTSRLVSADYPGAACRLIEQYVPQSRALFVLAPCGDTQPWIATQDDPAQIDTVARAAAAFVALQAQAVQPIAGAQPRLQVATKTITLGRGEADLVVWRLGGVWFVGLPGEVFQELGLDLRKQLGAPVVIMTLANGWSGYIPTRQAFAEGGYEVDAAKSNKLQPGDGERMIDEVMALTRTLE